MTIKYHKIPNSQLLLNFSYVDFDLILKSLKENKVAISDLKLSP